MKLPRHTASTPPPRETGLVRADPGALTNTGDAQFRAMEGAGRALQDVAEIGFKAFMDRQALDDEIYAAEAGVKLQDSIKLGVDTAAGYDVKASQPLSPDIKDYWDGGKLNPFDIKAKTEFYTEISSESNKRIAELAKAFKNPKTRALWEANAKAESDLAITKALNAKHQEHQESTILGYAKIAAENGDIELSNQWIDIAKGYGLIGPKRASAEMDKNVRRKKLAEEKAKIVAKEVLELKREIDRDKIGQAFQDETIDYDIINNSTLDEKEQETYRVRMNTEIARRLKGKPIVTNQSIKGDIEAEAYKIWLGAVDPKDYDKILFDARYGEVVDGKTQYVFGKVIDTKPLIDDSAYDELRTLGVKELKTSQAKGLAEASFYAKGQLVEVTDELDFQELLRGLDAPKKKMAQSERQIQLENWSQFNRSMKLWQAEKDDAVEGDYYIESRRKLPFYRSRVDEEVLSGKLPKEGKKTNNATVIMTSPDGKRYEVPIGKKQKFIDNGYTE